MTGTTTGSRLPSTRSTAIPASSARTSTRSSSPTAPRPATPMVPTAAGNLRLKGVRTFVIGFGAGVTASDLNEIADQGGTGSTDTDNDGLPDCLQFETCSGPANQIRTGDGVIIASNRDELVEALKGVFEAINLEPSTFATGAIPSGQSETEDTVALTHFQPMETASVWPGTINQFVRPLKLVTDGQGGLRPDTSRGVQQLGDDRLPGVERRGQDPRPGSERHRSPDRSNDQQRRLASPSPLHLWQHGDRRATHGPAVQLSIHPHPPIHHHRRRARLLDWAGHRLHRGQHRLRDGGAQSGAVDHPGDVEDQGRAGSSRLERRHTHPVRARRLLPLRPASDRGPGRLLQARQRSRGQRRDLRGHHDAEPRLSLLLREAPFPAPAAHARQQRRTDPRASTPAASSTKRRSDASWTASTTPGPATSSSPTSRAPC